ncbi:MAG: DUF3419 family protein [Candidatus Aminicenantes bacterium]|nr:DUF3419 family protein [Candidatus Aminicenantes bacterium]
MKPPYNYGLSQEDALTEERALGLRAGDRLLCIASAGEVPLNLLARRDLTIEAVDTSPGQLALSRLKAAACRTLEPLEAAALLGFTDTSPEGRRRLFRRAAERLDDDDRRFWTVNGEAIDAGPIRAARFERYLGRFSPAVRTILGRRKLLGLFEQETLADRERYFDRRLSTGALKAVFKTAFHPALYRKRGIAEEGLRHVAEGGPGGFFYSRFRDFCTVTPAKTNYYLQFIFFGRVLFPEALPEYLGEEGLRRVRREHGRIAWRLASFQDVLKAGAPGAFNRFHLSNIGDWMGCDEYARLLELLRSRAVPPATAVSRYIHLDHPVPRSLDGRIVRMDGRGEELMRTDRFPFYHLVVMELR